MAAPNYYDNYDAEWYERAIAGDDAPAPRDDGSAAAAYALMAVGFVIGCAILGWAFGDTLRQLVR